MNPLKVAVIGSGPAGLYTAEALTKQAPGTEIDVFDRLPTPYGLVRYGVAPDHTSIKSIADYLRRVLEAPGVRFVGDVELGRDVRVEELLDCYHAVVYATGAMVDRHLNIPGEDLPGSIAATDFVNWYCGHPDVPAEAFEVDSTDIAVIGVGNVAVDVVRILAKTAEELRPTDVPVTALEALDMSLAQRIHMIGRRGPAHAKFTTKELRELGELPSTDVVVRTDEIELDEAQQEIVDSQRKVRANVEVLRKWAAQEPTGRPRRLEVRFWLRPVEIIGRDRVEGLRLERTRLDESGRVTGTGEFETIPVGMVLRSVGYRSVPLPGVPFDEKESVVPNDAGRLLADGRPVPRQYVAGWLKRGPTGVIGTNKSDAAETVRSLLADAGYDGVRPVRTIDDILRIEPVSYEDWLCIEAAEADLARSLGRGERVKLVGLDALYGAIRQATRRP